MSQLAAAARIAGTCMVLAAGAPALASEQAAKVFDSVSPSVYSVVAQGEGGATMQGSAVVIAPGKLATNHHVIAGAKSIIVRQGSQSFEAQLESADAFHDIATLTAYGLDAPVVKFGDQASVRVGQTVYAIGSPQGLELSLSEGIVSSLRKFKDETVFQITAPISPGSSGGGLFDEHGRLIGLTTAQAINGQNLNFAIPVSWLKLVGLTVTPEAVALPAAPLAPSTTTAPAMPVSAAKVALAPAPQNPAPAASKPPGVSSQQLILATVLIVALALLIKPAARWLSDAASDSPAPTAKLAQADRLEPFRSRAREELSGKQLDAAVWVKALEQTQGNEALAIPIYIAKRAQALYQAERDRKWAEAKARSSAEGNRLR